MEFSKVNNVCLKYLTKLAKNQLLIHMKKLLELLTLRSQNVYSVTFYFKSSVDVTDEQCEINTMKRNMDILTDRKAL